jgi:plastocyanin
LAHRALLPLNPRRRRPQMSRSTSSRSFPSASTVKAGTTVTWINEDDAPHTVASSNKLFKSKALDTGDKFSFTFTTPGTYAYFCSVHPHMTGTVVVEAASGADAAH